MLLYILLCIILLYQNMNGMNTKTGMKKTYRGDRIQHNCLNTITVDVTTSWQTVMGTSQAALGQTGTKLGDS